MSYRNIKLSLIFAFILAIVGSFMAFTAKINIKAEESSGGAYFLHEDRSTKGTWYNGEKGTKEFASLRNYGKDGVVLMYHKAYLDGKMFKDVSDLNDFTEDSRPHYVEYPDWVESISGDIKSHNDQPHGYWNNRQFELDVALKNAGAGGYDSFDKQLLPIDPERQNIIHTACQFTREDMNYTVIVRDNEWRIVTAYVGSAYANEKSYATTNVSVCDINGNVLSDYFVTDVNVGVYVSFAVKGSFVLHVDKANSAVASLMGVFFDSYHENTLIGVNSVSAVRSGAKEIRLSWTNIDDNSLTNVYRREMGSDLWESLGCLPSGVSAYIDKDTKMNSTYEYMLASGLKREIHDIYYDYKNVPNVCDFNLPDTSQIVTCETAAYKSTVIRFTASGYGITADDELIIAVNVKRQSESSDDMENFCGVTVFFELSGENVYSEIGGKQLPNFDHYLGSDITNADGYAELKVKIAFAGEYQIKVGIPETPDETDPLNKGYDSYSTETSLIVYEKEFAEKNKPVLYSVTDAVKPGDAVTITGGNLKPDGNMLIAVAPADENYGREFSENNIPAGLFYITEKDLTITDSVNGTGVMFVFPTTAVQGVYDIWLRNTYGWSEKITMNAARPMYIDQEAAYAGLPLRIIGRNFYSSEYGVGDDNYAIENLRVKLVRTGDINGYNDEKEERWVLSVKNGGISSAVQYQKSQSFTDEIIYDTNPYKITVKVPDVWECGTFDVFVSTDGENYYGLSEPQSLIVYERKAQTWNTSVFGNEYDRHIGCDPLDLQVWWAQNLNYNNVITVNPNAEPQIGLTDNIDNIASVKQLTASINEAARNLERLGGGVIYLPEGDYYLTTGVELRSGVILVGAGVDKTRLFYVGSGNGHLIRAYNQMSGYVTGFDNVGAARMSVSVWKNSTNTPNYIFNFGDGDRDLKLSSSRNKFISDIRVDLPLVRTENEANSAPLMIGGERNLLVQNFVSVGGKVTYARVRYYLTVRNVYDVNESGSDGSPALHGKYSVIENCYFDLNYEGHGPSIRSDTYVAYSVCKNAGNRKNRTNDGEALLLEPPSGYFATGKVLASDSRSVTLDFMGGTKIDGNTMLHYNGYAVYIADGTGTGQLRYIDPVGQTPYTNKYMLADGEKDWSILPDSTSKFSILSPAKNVTVYKYKAEDCVATVTVYCVGTDILIKDCTLKDTAGISVVSVGQEIDGGRFNPVRNIRIENNDISGVGAHYKVGSGATTLTGGIQILINRSGEYMGLQLCDVVVKNNYLHDLIPDTECSEIPFKAGLLIYSGSTVGQDISSDARYVVLDGNIIENSEWGIYCDNRVTGVFIRNNDVRGELTVATEKLTLFTPSQIKIFAGHSLFVGHEESKFSGEYEQGSVLPVLPDDTATGKCFFGWSTSGDDSVVGQITTVALGYNCKLYARYGYKVTFDLNYETSSGEAAGEFNVIKTMGGSVKAEIDDYGNPFRKGRDFLGWYTDKRCTQKFDENSEINENVVAYAKWSGDDYGLESTPETESNAVGIIAIISGSVLLCAGAITVIVIKKRKKKDKSESFE